MQPLCLDDLVSLDEYSRRRREFFHSHQRYVDRHRRVRIGPSITLLFENRQTLWFRVMEVIRIARLVEPGLIQAELNLFNQLLPTPQKLQAALIIDFDESRLNEERAMWGNLDGERIHLTIGSRSFPAELYTSRPEDRCAGAEYWVHFAIAPEQQQAFLDFRQPVFCELHHAHYRHESLPLNEDVRQSLFDDLASASRDEAA